MSDIDQLVNIKHAAKLCGISRTRFYQLMDSERGPTPVFVDGARHFDREVLKEWNQQRKTRRKWNANTAA
jgi:predicted DNA-binding transcriptional regulator AlpA